MIDPSVSGGSLLHALEGRADHGTVPDELREPLGLQHPSKGDVLPSQPHVLDGPLERLLDEGGLRGLAEVVEGAELHGLHAVVVVRPARQDHHLAGKVLVVNPPQGFEASDAGHPEVQEHHVEGARRQAIQRGLAVRDAFDVMPRAEPLLHHAGGTAPRRRRPARSWAVRWIGYEFVRSWLHRQFHDHGRAPAWPGARDPDRSLVLLDDGPADGQAEPDALADFLGGEERIEHLGQSSGAMPRPASRTVSSTRPGPRACGFEAHVDLHRCRPIQGVECVRENVDHYLPEHDRIRSDAVVAALPRLS